MAPTKPGVSNLKRAKSRKTSETSVLVGTNAAERADGITSDSKLIEATLANSAGADDYWEWMMAHRGTVDPDLDLDF